MIAIQRPGVEVLRHAQPDAWLLVANHGAEASLQVTTSAAEAQRRAATDPAPCRPRSRSVEPMVDALARRTTDRLGYRGRTLENMGFRNGSPGRSPAAKEAAASRSDRSLALSSRGGTRGA